MRRFATTVSGTSSRFLVTLQQKLLCLSSGLSLRCCSSGLISRSRLLCSFGGGGLEAVLGNMVDKRRTIENAVDMGSAEFFNECERDTDSIIDKILSNCPDELPGLVRRNGCICWRGRRVTFFGANGSDLLVVIPDPASVKGMKRVHTLKLRPRDDALDDGFGATLPQPPYEPYGVYSIPNGLVMIEKGNYSVIVHFVVTALIAHQQQTAQYERALKLPPLPCEAATTRQPNSRGRRRLSKLAEDGGSEIAGK